jgi:DNA-binding XRE family transcriptional regulator
VPRFPHELLHDMRQRRQAIPPRATVIGNYVRIPGRVGKPVTQEELAEALAISREWYCTLENGRCAEVSVELASNIAYLLYDRRTARQLRASIQESTAVSMTDMRRYVKRVAAAPTYFDAAVEAMETGARLLAVDCVSVINFEEIGRILGRAVGPRSHFWKPLCDRIVHDAHRRLRNGGVGISESIPTADEGARDPSVLVSFESLSSKNHDYEYECPAEIWHEFNRDVGVRSVVAAPLMDRAGYRGTIAVSWSEPRRIELREVEVLRTLAGVLQLVS